jgi:CheY-like chemotaxis protein
MSRTGAIILVEDDPRDLELTLAALERCGLINDVVVLRDGVEALDYIYRREAFADLPPAEPAVMLLDLKLPRVNGLEVTRSLKSDPAQRHIPIVMLTSSGEEKDLVDSYALGVNAFVVKPVDFQAFSRAMQDLGVFWALHNRVPRL